MAMVETVQTQDENQRIGLSIWVRFVLVTIVLPAVALFVPAGTLRWPMGWAFITVLFIGTVASRMIAWRVHPDMLRERARYGRRGEKVEGVKAWDRVIVPFIGSIGPLATFIVAGLDYRLDWLPDLPLWLQITGLVALIAGYAFTSWAFVTNRFFSAMVRIQKDRGHYVVTDGPYRIVRHPGYAGGLLSYPGMALMLGSMWALIPTVLTFTVMVIRTALEDRTLHAELEGYAEYAQRTRYRLLPGIW